jgi:hypothetical protein
MPDTSTEEAASEREIEEYEFILGNMSLDELFKSFHIDSREEPKEQQRRRFDFSEEILNVLAHPEGASENGNTFSYGFRSILFLRVETRNQKPVPAKLNRLISVQLSKQKNTILRQIGSGYLYISDEPNHQIDTLINLLRHLDEYNAAIPVDESVFILGALSVIEKKQKKPREKEFLSELVKASHLFRLAEKLAEDNQGSAGTIIIQAGEKDLADLKKQGITLLAKGKARLLPGLDTPYSEIIWRNPLNLLSKGQTYKINRFELRSCLVKHNTYATYQAVDTQLDRPVIVKIMLPQNTVAILQNPARRDDLFEKLRAIGRINHPSIANLYDMGEHHNMIYFVREYIEGKPVAEHRFSGDQRETEILNVLHTLLRALITAQRQGVAHLNLKSGNIWLSEAQQIKITDFFFAGFNEDFAKSNVLFPAQWRNIAPEILSGDIGDFRSDIYSLGILAYELITGQHPYKTTGSINSPNDIRKVKVLPLAKHKTPHNPAWDAFVMKAIYPDPNKRFQTLNEMELELRKIQMQLMQQALIDTDS